MLQSAYSSGVQDALRKFALAAPTPADAFSTAVEKGKDMPPPHAGAIALPQEPAAALGDPNGALPTKDAALSLKDLAWFRSQLGEEAGNNFLAKHDLRTQKGIPQNFRSDMPVQTTLTRQAPMPSSVPSNKVIIDPSLGALAAQHAHPRMPR